MTTAAARPARWRVGAVALAGALACSVVVLAPVQAQTPPEVPGEVEIEDPAGDANYLNDQGVGVTEGGDVTTPADGGSISDILKVWFTDTPTTISAHIQTEAPPGATTVGLFYRVRVDPGAGENCLWIEGSQTGTTNPNPSAGSVRNLCVDDVRTEAEFVQVEGPGGTGLHTITFPRADIGLGDGDSLKTPTAETRHSWAAVIVGPQIDNTAVGKDYVIGSRGEGGGGGAPKPGPSGTAGPAPTTSPGPSASPSTKPTSPPDKDKKKKKCPNKKKGSNSKKCKKKKGKGRPKPSPSPTPSSTSTATPAPTATPEPTPTGRP